MNNDLLAMGLPSEFGGGQKNHLPKRRKVIAKCANESSHDMGWRGDGGNGKSEVGWLQRQMSQKIHTREQMKEPVSSQSSIERAANQPDLQLPGPQPPGPQLPGPRPPGPQPGPQPPVLQPPGPQPGPQPPGPQLSGPRPQGPQPPGPQLQGPRPPGPQPPGPQLQSPSPPGPSLPPIKSALPPGVHLPPELASNLSLQNQKKKINQHESDGNQRSKNDEDSDESDESDECEDESDESGDEQDDGDEEKSLSAYDNIPLSHTLLLRGHERVVTALSIDPKCSRLLSGSGDYSLKMWNFAGMDSSARSFRR
jgi:hypothetical protein